MLRAHLQNILKLRKLDLFDSKLEPRLQNHSFFDCHGNSKLKMQRFSHHSSAVVLLPSPTEQFDIHHPGVEMARSHIKQRHDSFVSALLLGGAYYHQHLRSAQYFPFPRRPLSAFPWLLHSSAIDVGLYSTAPPRTADLSLAIFCLRGLKHGLDRLVFFLGFFFSLGFFCVFFFSQQSCSCEKPNLYNPVRL